jgi:hypothetical protein
MKTVAYKVERMAQKAIVPSETNTVVFYGDEVIITVVEQVPYVPLRPIVDNLGLTWGSQYNRTKRDEVLDARTQLVSVAAADGKAREMLALPLDLLPGWLFGIQPSRVRDGLRDKLQRYRAECFRALWDAFQEGRLTAEPSLDALLTADTPAVQAYKMAQAIMQMARQQILLEARLDRQDGRLDSAESKLSAVENRLETVEATLGDASRHISAAQASHISQAVKAIALELGKRSGRNEFGGVYGELYRRFEIAGYRELPAARYDEATNFLRQWYSAVSGGDDVPF